MLSNTSKDNAVSYNNKNTSHHTPGGMTTQADTASGDFARKITY